MPLKLITAPSVEPVSLVTAKLHLRQDTTADDALITALIVAARQQVESDCNLALITQIWDLYLDAFPGNSVDELLRDRCGYLDPRSLDLVIPLSPLLSVTSVTSNDDNNASTVFSSSNYIVDAVSRPPRIALTSTASWPTNLRPINGAVIRFTAGYGPAATDVPQALIQAMLLLIGHWYENREQIVTNAAQALSLPFGYAELINNYRVYWAG